MRREFAVVKGSTRRGISVCSSGEMSIRNEMKRHIGICRVCMCRSFLLTKPDFQVHIKIEDDSELLK